MEPGTGLMGNGNGSGFGRDLGGYTCYGDTQGFDSDRVLVLEMLLLGDVWPLERHGFDEKRRGTWLWTGFKRRHGLRGHAGFRFRSGASSENRTSGGCWGLLSANLINLR